MPKLGIQQNKQGEALIKERTKSKNSPVQKQLDLVKVGQT